MAIAYVLVGILGYWGHARLAFGERGWQKIVRYGIANLFVWAVNAGLLHLLISMGAGPVLAQAICYAVTVPAGYLVMRWWVFR